MNGEVKEKNAKSMKIFGMILPSLPHLILRFGGVYLKFRSEAKKGARIFQKELLKQGIDKETAEELTEIYLESSNLLKYIRNLT